jgi:hypothetical protein
MSAFDQKNLKDNSSIFLPLIDPFVNQQRFALLQKYDNPVRTQNIPNDRDIDPRSEYIKK